MFRRCASKKAAEKAAELIDARLKLGQGIPEKEPKKVPTLRDYYEGTLEPMWKASLSDATFKSYEGSFRVHVRPALGSLRLDEITRTKVREFVVSLLTKHVAVRSCTSGGPESPAPRLLSKESIRNIVAALRSAFTEAVEADNLPVHTNPVARVGKFYKEAADFHEEFDPFTADEVSLLLGTMREHFGFENYVLLLTLFHCGLRAGEAAGLWWSDLDLRNRTLIVRRQLSRGQTRKPKTRKKRQVDVSPVLLAELQALRKQRQAAYLKKGKNEIPEAIFLGPGVLLKDGERTEGKPLDMNNWRNRVYWKACDRAKIRRRRLHDTRHTFASMLLNNGESLKYVSAQLGHPSIRMTADVYGHLEVGSNREAVNRLPSLRTASLSAVAH